MQGIDKMTLIGGALVVLALVVAVLLLVATIALRRALRTRDARLAQLAHERKLAEEHAAHAEEIAARRVEEAHTRVERLLGAGALGGFEWDVASGRLLGEPGFAARLGVHESAPHLDAWLRLAHPEDAARLAALPERLDAADRASCEVRLREPGGNWRWMRVDAQVLERDAQSGAAQRIVGVQQDIDAAKRLAAALDELRRLFAAGPVITLALDAAPPHALRQASEALQRARGCRPGEPVPVGANLADLMHREDAQALRQAIAPLVERADPAASVQREVRLLHASGRWDWYLLHLTFSGDEPARLQGYLIDIERLKQAEAQAAAQSSELQQLVQRMTATQRFLQSVQQITELLQLTEDEADGREIVGQAGPELFPRWAGALSFAMPNGAMEVAARWGGFEPPRPCAESDCWAVRRGRLHLTSAGASAQGLQPVCGHFGGRALPAGVAHAICVPLFTSSERPGALHLVTRERLAEDEVRAAVWGAETVADALKLSLANLRLRLSLREQAVRDWMTGLYNRRYFDEVLRHELSRSERTHETLTLALLDIDHFKSFNDSFGHEAGDEVIKAVARQLLGFVRSYDIACRVGGEELAVLMPRAHLQETSERLDQLRERIGKVELQHEGLILPAITVSIGVAALGPDAGEDILRRADVALYAAKHAGRNRLMCWTAELESSSLLGSFDDSQRVVSAAK